MTEAAGSPTIRTARGEDAPVTPLPGVGEQRVLLGTPRGDTSPMLVGVTTVEPGRTSALIEHDTAEVAYVLSGDGAMVTDRGEHPFGPGDAVLIEPGCWHAIRAGKSQVRMVYAFPTPSVPPTRARRADVP